MESFDFPFSLSAKWGGIGVLFAWWLVGGIFLTYVTLRCLRHDGGGRRGTRRTPVDPPPSRSGDADGIASPVALAIASPRAAAALGPPHGIESMPPVPRISYTFSDVVYTVRVPRAKGDTSGSSKMVDKVLLRGVTGYFEPVSGTAQPWVRGFLLVHCFGPI
jgi:hypothetical protein